MSAVWESRWAEYVRRCAALRESTSLELIQDLMPVLPVVDPGLPEMSLLRRDKRCAGWTTAPAVAAQQGYCEVRNPAGSGLLVVVDKARAWPAVAGAAMGFRAQLTTLGGGALASTRAAVDTRSVGPAVATIYVGTAAVALPGLEYAQGSSPVGVEFGPYILEPGDNIIVWSLTANAEVNFSFRWRERAVDGSELVPSGA